MYIIQCSLIFINFHILYNFACIFHSTHKTNGLYFMILIQVAFYLHIHNITSQFQSNLEKNPF